MKPNRRKFIQQSGMAIGAGLVLPKLPFGPTEGERVLFFMPQWGTKLSLSEFLSKVKTDGYDGIEMSLPNNPVERKDTISKIKSSGLQYIAQIYQPKELDVKKHIEEARGYVLMMSEAEPLFINSHTGRDFFSFEQNLEIIENLNDYSKTLGVKLIHETHRSRFAFAAHVTKPYLEKLSELRLTFDVSHWICVAESFLENQPESIGLAIQRTDHIHSRVGFTEGPQISDPRAPELKFALDAHISMWDKIINLKRKKGEPITITTEFGPPPYMPAQPYTGQPVVNQWEINVFMKELLSKRYNQ